MPARASSRTASHTSSRASGSSPVVGSSSTAASSDHVAVALADVVQWTVLLAESADLGAAYGAVAQRLAQEGEPALVTAAIVSALGVPGGLIELSAVAAVLRERSQRRGWQLARYSAPNNHPRR